MIDVHKIELPVSGFDQLLAEAQAEGYGFVATLSEEWANAKNRFNAPAEILCGAFKDGQVVAVGGLNIDPFARNPETGRIRKVYVRPAWRNQGVGRALMLALIEEARKGFRSVRLRAENANAARLYERLGFIPIDDPSATHILHS